MPDMKLLSEKINDSGMKVTAIADKTGMLRATIYNRLNGRGSWTAEEIVAMSEVLHLTKTERDRIFLS